MRGPSTGRKRRTSSTARMPSGTLMRNMSCQPNPAIRAPPSDGPSAVPTADMVPSKPMALPARALGTESATDAIVRAIMIAAPKPCAVRAAISSPSVGARLHSAEATVNKAMPAISRRRRPIRSPSRPALTIRVVMASR
ncbi:hypothetical protein FQZ97_909070 [compost metagenome]